MKKIEKDSQELTNGKENVNVNIQRYKGLGNECRTIMGYYNESY